MVEFTWDTAHGVFRATHDPLSLTFALSPLSSPSLYLLDPRSSNLKACSRPGIRRNLKSQTWSSSMTRKHLNGCPSPNKKFVKFSKP